MCQSSRTYVGAGESFHKIINLRNSDANNVTTQGAYIVNLHLDANINYPNVRCQIILEVFSIMDTNTYVVQRVTCFTGGIFTRSKTNKADWTPWVKAGAA